MALEDVGLRAVIEGTDKYVSDASRIQQAEKGIVAQAQATSSATQKSSFSFTELRSAVGLAEQGLHAAEQAYRAVIVPTVAYAKQVRDLSRTIGASAEESSKLIQAADDMNVSVGTLEAGLKAAIRKGFDPTIEGLGKIADQYVAIQDPIARTKFLMDTFGRSGADLGALMEKGSAGLKAAGDEAERLGLVLSQKDVQAARQFEIATDNLDDAWKGFTYTLGNKAIPYLTNLFNAINNGIAINNLFSKATQAGVLTQKEQTKIYIGLKYHTLDLAETTQLLETRLRGVTDIYRQNVPHVSAYARATVDAEAAAKSLSSALAAGLSGELGRGTEDVRAKMEKLTEQITKLNREQGKTATVTNEAKFSQLDLANAQFDAETSAMKLAEAQKKLAENTDPDKQRALEGAVLDASVAVENANGKIATMTEGLGGATTYTIDHTKKIKELQGEYDALSAQLTQTTNKFIYQQLAVEGDDKANLELAHQLGILDDASYNAAIAAGILKQNYEQTGGSAKVYAANAAELARAVALLQSRNIEITVTTIQRTINEINDVHVTGGGQSSTTGSSRRQHGGLTLPGDTYSVNEAGTESGFGLVSGMLSLLRGTSFTPREPTMVIPAERTRDLISPALLGAGRGGGGAVSNSQSVSVGPNYISGGITQAQFNQRLRRALGA